MSRARLSPGVGRLLVVLAAAAGVLAAACGAPSANYQRDPSGHLVFALPTQWTVFSQTELYRNSNPDASYVAARNATSGQWTIGFDGGPTPSVDELLTITSPRPTGFAKVRPATAAEQQSLATYAGLRNLVFSLDSEVRKDPTLVRIDSSRVLHFSGGYRALEVTFSVRDSIARPFTTFTQVAAVDAGVQHVYLLLIGCGADCYHANLTSIDRVISSWTLKEH